jgi:hypothetical protein
MEVVKDQKNCEKKQRADEAKLKHQQKFQAAAKTFFEGGHLNCDALHVIIQETKQKDCPIKKKYDDLKSQLESHSS